ncbi:retron St85 family RNA-directed DNA polymerase [Enterocloster bolteae]|uniref:retron St85 family RNA-directed DNA polymerase n=1 Tax=Enterocloster bolteae TaxID=208479 RepID=UPI0026764F46|nr:retron St85 family RNA-directed DNA polymerase [Enterocloster bolteae]
MNISNNVILNTLNVPIINGFTHLAEQLSLTKGLLYFLTYQKNYCYTLKEIPKKDGTFRKICIPNLSLKVVQKWILIEILEKINVSKQAMAFVPKKNGLKSNAEYHKKNIFLLEMDIENFFGTIKEEQVFRLFCNIGYNTKVSTILTSLCTFDGELPQGAVTSPYLANLILFHLDARLNGLCSRKDIVYTRYADDLSFSSNDRAKLNGIENFVKYIVSDEGFEINEKKTRYLSNDVKKSITGITINNEEIHVDKKFKRKIRSMIFNSIANKNYALNDKIRGSIAYVNSIEPGYQEKMYKYIEQIINKYELKNDSGIVKSFNENKLYKSLPDLEYEESPFI